MHKTQRWISHAHFSLILTHSRPIFCMCTIRPVRTICWRFKYKHTNHWHYIFAMCSREKTLFFHVVVLLFRCTPFLMPILHIYVCMYGPYVCIQTSRVVTHPHLKFIWTFFFVILCLSFLVVFFFFFSHSVCLFDLILPHCCALCFFSLHFIEH